MRKVPLADEALNVAIFSLSLMGENWPEYIKEAKRCLVTKGCMYHQKHFKLSDEQKQKLVEHHGKAIKITETW